MSRTIVGNAYIRNLESLHTLQFYHFSDEITDSVQPNYADIDVTGRSSPLSNYNNTGARRIALELNFAASAHQADSNIYQPPMISSGQQPGVYELQPIGSAQAQDPMESKIDFLRSLVYPRYVGELMYPPPRVLLSVGGFIKIKGFVVECSVIWKRPWIDQRGGIPSLADVQLEVQQLVEVPFSSSDILEGRDRRTFAVVGGRR